MRDQFQLGPATRAIQYFFRLVDVIALEIAYFLAYLTVPLVKSALLANGVVIYREEVTSLTAILVPLVWLVVLEVRGLYGDPARISYTQITKRLLQSTLLGLGILGVVLFALKQGGLSRLLFFIFGAYSFLILMVVRVAEKMYLVQRHRAGHYSEKLIIVGPAEDAHKVQRTIADRDVLGDYDLIGYMDTSPALHDLNSSVPYLGKTENLKQEIATQHVSEVVVVWNSREPSGVECALDACREMGIRVRVLPAFVLNAGETALAPISARPDSFWGLSSIVLSQVKWQPNQEFLKRMMDMVVSSALLVILSPLLLTIAIAVKLTSEGAVLHRYEMVGKDGRVFWGQKFRSMVANAHAMRAELEHMNQMKGPVFKIKDDPRITRVGRWLRKYSLDEIPQLWSVLKGDMSLVGPRPPGPYEAEKFAYWHWKKMKVRPGMTSLWIIRGKPSDFDEWVRLDIEYIDNWSIWLDLVILVRTIPVVVLGRNH